MRDTGLYLGSCEGTREGRISAILQIADEMVGMRPESQHYQCLLYPDDTPAHAAFMAAKQSKCTLTCAAIIRLLGATREQAPELWGAYWGRTDATSRLVAFAQKNHIWLHADTEPEVGDMIIIGLDVAPEHPEAPHWGRPAHGCTVVEVSPDHITTVDGGFAPVKRTVRKITRRAVGSVWVDSRRIYGVIRLPDFEPAGEWVLP